MLFVSFTPDTIDFSANRLVSGSPVASFGQSLFFVPVIIIARILAIDYRCPVFGHIGFMPSRICSAPSALVIPAVLAHFFWVGFNPGAVLRLNYILVFGVVLLAIKPVAGFADCAVTRLCLGRAPEFWNWLTFTTFGALLDRLSNSHRYLQQGDNG